jgi:N-succinyldiaminopimelate aminotransferase
MRGVPRFPAASASVTAIRGSVFSALAHRIETHQGEVYPFHVGDTWLEPPAGCWMQDLRVDNHPGMHRYAQPEGLPRLLDAIVERSRERFGVSCERSNVLVATGATGALGAVAGALLDPGDEVLVLAPHWPLITGIISSFHGRSIVVPFLGAVTSASSAVDIVAAHKSERTVALYLNTPNNPTGAVIPRSWLESLVAWAEREGLWILADEVYEDLQFDGEHTYCRRLAPERTFSVHSFSKAYGMAGNRCGYVVGPAGQMSELRKVATHTFYSTPTASQLLAIRILEGAGETWLRESRALYQRLALDVARQLELPPPRGSTFLFFDVEEHLDARGLMGFLEDCAERGIFLAPGPSFGPYPTHVRLCYTAAPPEVTTRGVSTLATLLGRHAKGPSPAPHTRSEA